jgi:hypothetical protein
MKNQTEKHSDITTYVLTTEGAMEKNAFGSRIHKPRTGAAAAAATSRALSRYTIVLFDEGM